MLINCVVYQEGRKLADIGVEAISDHLARPGCFVWVALQDASAEELAAMQREFGLHELAVEDAQHGHQRPKIEEYDQTVFVVMQLMEFKDDSCELHVGEVDVFTGPNFVLSVRNRSSQGFLGVRERCEREPELLRRQGAGFVLYALMDAVVDRYLPVIERFEAELDAIEDRIFERQASRANIERLYALKRRIMTLRHAAMPLLESVGKLTAGRVPNVCEGNQAYFRDVFDHLGRVNATVDNLRETIALAVQANLSMVAIEDAETTKRLAAWAGIVAVPTALAGIWGMNFAVMPELHWRWGYPAALGTIALVCSLLWWRFRRAGWL